MDAKDVARVMQDPIAQELLNSPLLAHLAYSGADGFPRVVPIGGIWNGSEYVICTATKAPKVAALMRDPKVALTINTEIHVNPPHILLVRGVAHLDIVDGIPVEYLDASRKAAVCACGKWAYVLAPESCIDFINGSHEFRTAGFGRRVKELALLVFIAY